MAGSKGLKRLAFFVVFLIPVGWYLFLQLFGDNKFSLEIQSLIPAECSQFENVAIIYTSEPLSMAGVNHLNRVTFGATTRDVPIILDNTDFLNCTGVANELVLVNSQGIWGMYDLDREGVDRLLVEIDILLLQKSYGQGTSR